MTGATENKDFDSLFKEYWSDVAGVLSGTLEEISSNYAKADFNQAAVQREIAEKIAVDYDYFSQRASDLAKRASQAGMEMRPSAQNAMDSASMVFKQHADSLRSDGIAALQKIDSSLLSSVNRTMLAKFAGQLGVAGDILDISLKTSNEDYYGAAGSFIGAVAATAAAALAIGTLGWFVIPSIVGAGIFGFFVSDAYEKIFNYLDPLGINSDVNGLYHDGLSFVPRRDPLTLDLNGNGIETLGLEHGITFDFNGDGTKTSTGWIAPSDGLLVLDKDNNGIIDNGNELFGVDTIKSDGTKAIDGFDALRDLDSNGDGIFDHNDEMFAKVRVWQDLNSDGISQTDELKTLGELGIVGINLDAKKTNIDSNGNLISAVGTFIREDGSTGEANANQSVVANLDLADNPFYREFTDTIELDEDSYILPNLLGSGAVRDLQEATMLNQNLKQLLTDYSSAETRKQQLDLLDAMIAEWSETGEFETFDKQLAALTLNGMPLEFKFSWEVNGIQPTQKQLETRQFFERLAILETFNAKSFIEFKWITDAQGEQQLSAKVGALETLVKVNPSTGIVTEKDIQFNASQVDFLERAYQALTASVYDGLLLKTRLMDYTLVIEVSIDEDGNASLFHFSELSALLNSKFTDSPAEAVRDLLDLDRVFGAELTSIGSQHLALLQSWIASSVETEIFTELAAAAQDFGYDIVSTGQGTNKKNNILVSTEDGGMLVGGSRNDLIIGGDGDDILSGGAGDDILYGGLGNDTYRYELGGGHDTIIETRGDSGTDTLLFGEGIRPGDISISKEGNNLLFRIGSTGSISIANWFNSLNDEAHRLDIVRFADGRSFNLADLQLATGETPTLESLLGNGILIGDAAENTLLGSDGDDWLDGGSNNDIMQGGKGDDTYVVDSVDDVVIEHADEGIDTVESNVSYTLGDNVENLTLLGHKNLSGTGNELDNIIRGNSGDNYLDGGTGEDTLIGGRGNDTYVVNSAGDQVIEKPNEGFDTVISSIDYTLGDNLEALTLVGDALVGKGNEANNVLTGNELDNELYGYDGDDILDGGKGADLMVGGAGDDTYIVDNAGDLVVELANEGIDTVKSSIDYQLTDHVENLTLTGQDNLTGEGNELDNVIIGNSGDNTLYGYDGDDTLDGGAGADILIGGRGNDTYIVDNVGDQVIERMQCRSARRYWHKAA